MQCSKAVLGPHRRKRVFQSEATDSKIARGCGLAAVPTLGSYSRLARHGLDGLVGQSRKKKQKGWELVIDRRSAPTPTALQTLPSYQLAVFLGYGFGCSMQSGRAGQANGDRCTAARANQRSTVRTQRTVRLYCERWTQRRRCQGHHRRGGQCSKARQRTTIDVVEAAVN